MVILTPTLYVVLWCFTLTLACLVPAVEATRVTVAVGVTITPAYNFVYKSGLLPENTLEINGYNFSKGMKLTFKPPALYEGVDYWMEYISPQAVKLTLLPGRRWRNTTGEIRIFSTTDNNGIEYILDVYHQGTCVAVAINDPIISPDYADNIIRLSQENILIRGQDFLTEDMPKDFSDRQYHRAIKFSITFSPTSPNAYTLRQRKLNYISMRLNNVLPGSQWAPNFTTPVPLQVMSLDCGGGIIVYDPPITIGRIYKDVRRIERPPPPLECLNTCPFARDGECDDGRGVTKLCVAGTDCQDCGPSSKGNLTRNHKGYINNQRVNTSILPGPGDHVGIFSNWNLLYSQPLVQERVAERYRKAPSSRIEIKGFGFAQRMKFYLSYPCGRIDETTLPLVDEYSCFDTTIVDSQKAVLVLKDGWTWMSDDVGREPDGKLMVRAAKSYINADRRSSDFKKFTPLDPTASVTTTVVDAQTDERTPVTRTVSYGGGGSGGIIEGVQIATILKFPVVHPESTEIAVGLHAYKTIFNSQNQTFTLKGKNLVNLGSVDTSLIRVNFKTFSRTGWISKVISATDNSITMALEPCQGWVRNAPCPKRLEAVYPPKRKSKYQSIIPLEKKKYIPDTTALILESINTGAGNVIVGEALAMVINDVEPGHYGVELPVVLMPSSYVPWTTRPTSSPTMSPTPVHYLRGAFLMPFSSTELSLVKAQQDNGNSRINDGNNKHLRHSYLDNTFGIANATYGIIDTTRNIFGNGDPGIERKGSTYLRSHGSINEVTSTTREKEKCIRKKGYHLFCEKYKQANESVNSDATVRFVGQHKTGTSLYDNFKKYYDSNPATGDISGGKHLRSEPLSSPGSNASFIVSTKMSRLRSVAPEIPIYSGQAISGKQKTKCALMKNSDLFCADDKSNVAYKISPSHRGAVRGNWTPNELYSDFSTASSYVPISAQPRLKNMYMYSLSRKYMFIIGSVSCALLVAVYCSCLHRSENILIQGRKAE